ncbi:Cyclin-dependent kinase [Handroanthus impetiginosus]|uniref:Cyclin-dependent kinase n=1 Tax=Handroanthus impetiginosus TaxID=429701 RepID=A0A2G9IAV9_9LAMI|nr:Cyclin-dependent kinase [Handroanthus impetiginosus]
MGCVQGKKASYSQQRAHIEKLKVENSYVRGDFNKSSRGGADQAKKAANGGGERKISRESERGISGGRRVLERVPVKNIGADEMVDGWPKWLVENVRRDVLAGLVPKSADSYEKLAKVGRGTYSNVYKARDKSSGKIVALKKVRFDTSKPESVRFMAREIIMLKKLDHPNIIKLEGVATSRMQFSLYLVFDFMQSDLTKVISRPQGRLTEPQVEFFYLNMKL